MGKVDFAALKDFAKGIKHIVFEPNPSVSGADLKQGIDFLRNAWHPKAD